LQSGTPHQFQHKTPEKWHPKIRFIKIFFLCVLCALRGKKIMSWRPGIRTEIVFTVTVLMAGVAALVGVVFLKVEERDLLQQKVTACKQIITSLQPILQDEASSDPSSQGSRSSPTLQNLTVFLTQSRLFSRISIVNRDFRIVADSQLGETGKVLRDPELEGAIAGGKVYVHERDGLPRFSLFKKGPLFFSAPLSRGGNIVGGLRGELPLDDLRETLSHSQSIIVLYILFDVFVIVVVGSYLLSRIIANPLKKLVQMSEKIADGNLDLLGGPSGGDEVGKLFSSFQSMAARLREDRKKMEEYIRSLEAVNRELRRAQDEVLRSEKLASIGRLAAGVAHEVGNPTGAILGYVDLLSQGGVTKEEEREILERTGREAERIRRIVRELLDFSRPARGENEAVDVPAVIRSTLSLLSHQQKVWKQIEVVTDLPENIPKWRGDGHQLQQVMVNLFLNAADAMMGGGQDENARRKTLRVAVRILSPEDLRGFAEVLPRRRKGDTADVDYTILRSGGTRLGEKGEALSGIGVDVGDTGPGIPSAAMGKIFDPFFTTKAPGEGTGLGLAICLRIIESYGGRIRVQSEAGKGSVFTVLLPVFEEKDGAEKNSDC
jgi:two-component system, NtrC family, sensor kinase